MHITERLLRDCSIPPDFLNAFSQMFPKGGNNVDVLNRAKKECPALAYYMISHLPPDTESLILEGDLPKEILYNGNIEIKSVNNPRAISRILVSGDVNIKNVKDTLVFDDIRIDAKNINANKMVLQNDSILFIEKKMDLKSLLIHGSSISTTEMSLKRDLTVLNSGISPFNVVACNTLYMSNGYIMGGDLKAKYINMYDKSKIENHSVDTPKANINLDQGSIISTSGYSWDWAGLHE